MEMYDPDSTITIISESTASCNPIGFALKELHSSPDMSDTISNSKKRKQIINYRFFFVLCIIFGGLHAY